MGKKAWIILLVAIGVVIAIGIGLVATSQSRAEKNFCRDLATLQSSVADLVTPSPGVDQIEFQTNVAAVQGSWGNVKISAQHLGGVNMNSIDSAWNDFSQAAKNVPASASSGDAQQTISQSAQQLQSAVQSSMESYDCSDSSNS